MTDKTRRNCETLGRRVYEMAFEIHDSEAKGAERAFASQELSGDSEPLTITVMNAAAWKLFLEFVKERGLSEMARPRMN